MAPLAALDKRSVLACLVVAELLAMGLWFSAAAVVPQLALEWGIAPAQQAWLTMSVQLGFAVGAVAGAALNVADRLPTAPLIAASALAAAAANAAIALPGVGLDLALALRFVTGFALAGVYPPGMKLVATWCREDRGAGIGLLTGAITLGTALPHLMNALPLFGEGGMPPWRSVMWAGSAGALGAALLTLCFVRPGPFAAGIPPFYWRFMLDALRERATRLANYGYLGHMWELYAMWAWAPLMLIASYDAAGLSREAGRLAGFGAIAAGAAGCVLAGLLADRIGRTAVAIASLAVSGGCALVVGFAFAEPAWITLVCVVWGFAVPADSAQFSAAVSELTDPRYVGTALTVQLGLGFMLTLVSVQIVPALVDLVGWRWVFGVLAAGPAFAIWAMAALRAMPEASRMAGGRR